MLLFASTLTLLGTYAFLVMDENAVLVGLCLIVPGVVLFGGTAWMRVYVDGSLLLARDVTGWQPAVRLDSLARVHVVDPRAGVGNGRIVILEDRDGGQVRLSTVSLRLVRLYRLLGDENVVGRRVRFDKAMRVNIDSHRARD